MSVHLLQSFCGEGPAKKCDGGICEPKKENLKQKYEDVKCPQTGVNTEDGEPQQILGMVQCHGRDPPSLLLPSDSIKDTLEVTLQRSNQQPSADQLSGLDHNTTKSFCGGEGPAKKCDGGICEPKKENLKQKYEDVKCPQTGVNTEDGEPQQILGMVQCHGRDPPSLLLPSDSIKDTLEVTLQRSNQQPSADQLSGLDHNTTKVVGFIIIIIIFLILWVNDVPIEKSSSEGHDRGRCSSAASSK
ncbi:hypothetical protein DPX16_10415 [Anabarilius grahami]|uniref:Uncharacterized protein n=1 Tax=Anabarilius grahami TaxID=495550 RepID=A0A3N0Y4Y1_ANAGA|nr:hypothetical protein DPX16_10415 [Anabarilius grahami]